MFSLFTQFLSVLKKNITVLFGVAIADDRCSLLLGRSLLTLGDLSADLTCLPLSSGFCSTDNLLIILSIVFNDFCVCYVLAYKVSLYVGWVTVASRIQGMIQHATGTLFDIEQ